jgi:hypothetical protein
VTTEDQRFGDYRFPECDLEILQETLPPEPPSGPDFHLHAAYGPGRNPAPSMSYFCNQSVIKIV